MWMVQWITAVLMMVVFVHVLPMSLVINVMFVQLGGMDSQPVKVKYVIKCVSATVGPCTVQIYIKIAILFRQIATLCKYLLCTMQGL